MDATNGNNTENLSLHHCHITCLLAHKRQSEAKAYTF